MYIVSARTRELLTLAALVVHRACLLGPAAARAAQTPRTAAATWVATGGPFDPNYAAPVIDGDTVLVAANRAINAMNDRIDGVYIFQRAANGNWNYAGPLVEGQSGAPIAQRQPRHGPVLPGVCRCTNGARRAGR